MMGLNLKGIREGQQGTETLSLRVESAVWEKRSDEPLTWFNRFERYRLLGPQCSLEAASAALNPAAPGVMPADAGSGRNEPGHGAPPSLPLCQAKRKPAVQMPPRNIWRRSPRFSLRRHPPGYPTQPCGSSSVPIAPALCALSSSHSRTPTLSARSSCLLRRRYRFVRSAERSASSSPFRLLGRFSTCFPERPCFR